MKQHSLELVDEDENIYQCSNCGARGQLRDLISTECKKDEDKDDQPKRSGGLSGDIFGSGWQPNF